MDKDKSLLRGWKSISMAHKKLSQNTLHSCQNISYVIKTEIMFIITEDLHSTSSYWDIPVIMSSSIHVWIPWIDELSMNSIAWKCWLLWNNWLLQWWKKEQSSWAKLWGILENQEKGWRIEIGDCDWASVKKTWK